MKKKVLVVLMAAVLAFSVVACGEKESASATKNNEVSTENEDAAEGEGEFTLEQAQLAQEYLDMCEAYDKAVDLVNATPELLEVQELVDVMNELTAVVEEADECFADPKLLTTEVMDGLRASFEETYKFIDEVTALAGGTADTQTDADALAEIFTIGYCGADETENTYYFICDDEVSFGAIVILSSDMTKNLNVVGEIIDNGDGSVTIDDETGYSITFFVEEAEGGVILTLEDGTQVAMGTYDAKEVIDMIFAIEEETENIN